MTLHGIVLSEIKQSSLIIRALSSITPEQADLVVDSLAKLQRSWLVDRHDDYDGYMSIVISPCNIFGPSFILSGRFDAIELSEMRDGDLHTRARFGDIEAAIRTLLELLFTI